ncbi:MAG TPA: Nramp family divalent metal transporter [Bacillota bacterium]|nr:Nramp family divalent metal transporter [Bacillota bacterium]
MTPKPETSVDSGWRQRNQRPSLQESFRSVQVPDKGASFWRKFLAFSGPGYMVAVGYMDPGNWATSLAGGSAFGYTLLSVVLLSNLMAILFQTLALKLGIVAERDLAQACRDHFSQPVTWGLWVACEVAIAACDLAEVIGSAIALNLLFQIPLSWGVCLTALDVLAVIYLQNKGFRYLEAFVVTLISTIAICFLLEIIFSHPSVLGVFAGFVPRPEILTRRDMLFVAIGILGATVMPHNLYLHSAVVQTRNYERTPEGKREAIKFATLDSTLALMGALFINGAILVVAAAVFHHNGKTGVAEIQDAYKLLSPMLGVGLASVLFAVALLASGQNSTLTGTLAGQIVMEGFLNIRMRPWLRRLITRLIAIVPAVIASIFYGASGTAKLLVWSQVILSLQLSFAVFPLVSFTNSKAKMGQFANPWWLKALAWAMAVVILLLNAKLLCDISGLTGKLLN